MKRWKQFVSVLLVFAMLISFLPVTARAEGTAGGTCGANTTWTLEGGILTVSGTGAMQDNLAEASVPWYDYRSDITSIVIEEGVTSVASYAFSWCSNAESLSLPDSLISIGKCAFQRCESLTEIRIPEKVTTIGEKAFYFCSRLEAISLNSALREVSIRMLAECSALTSITLPDSVTTICESAFYGCDLLETADLGSGVTAIGNSAFGSCYSLASVAFPEGLKSIGEYAFSFCMELEDFPQNSNLTSIGAGAFRECAALKTVTIPATLTSIPDSAFTGCSGITELTIPGSITSIGDFSFSGVCSITSLTIPASVVSIGDNAFYECVMLENLSLQNGIKSIGIAAFGNCTALTSVTIPASVTAIGVSAFGSCAKLNAINVSSSNINYSSSGGILFNKNKSQLLAYPGGKAGAYTVPSTVTTIGDSAFCDCKQLTGITIPSGVTTIGSDAFTWCDGLTQVSLPNTVTSLGDRSFEICRNLTSLTLPTGLTAIPNGLVSYCSKLTSITIPANVTSIGGYAFSGCSGLTSISIPSKVTSIGMMAFADCTGFTRLSLPDSLTSIGSAAFSGCTGITSISFGPNLSTISEYGFSGCEALTQIRFTGDAPGIGDDAFSGVTATALYPNGNTTWTSSVMKDYGGTLTWSAEGDAAIGSNLLTISNGIFDYYSRVEEDVAEYTFTYDESWFLEPATTYNHDLAKMTFRVALAAADTDAEFIEALFRTLKMKNLDTNYPTPSLDTIGYTMGHKLLRDETGKEVTLIAVAVRGGGYGREWASNFTIGSGLEHYGFRTCASEIYGAIQRYINNQEISGDLCIWVTGYSRAAAVSNILAHKLNTAADNGTIAGLSRSGVFAYCFECPRTVQDDAPGFTTLDNNIFNIVNPVDLVPMVAPEKWDFNRYGITYYLPSAEVNYNGFSEAFAAMQASYRDIRYWAGSESTLVSDLTKTMDTQNKNLQTLVDALASGIGNQDNFQNRYQTLVRSAIEELGNGDLTAGEVIVAVLSLPIIGQIPKVAFLIPGIIKEVSKITHAHYPELCMAWLDSLDGSNLRRTVRTRYLTVNCPVNVSVYDSTGTLVAQIINDEVQEIEGSTIGAMIDENGQKVICLPLDEEFRIETTATADGTVSWQVEEYDIAAGEATRVINYYDIAITEGDILNGTAGTGVETDAQYSLTAPDGGTLNPSNELTAEEIVEHDVTVTSEGNGTVTGGGLFVTGEYAMVTAEADENETFLGWHVEDTLVSTETEYRFRVESDVQIVGKFTQTVPSVIRLSGKDRYLTAFAVANRLKELMGVTRFDTVIVAYGQNFPDALTGSYLAAVKNAPILLTEPNKDALVLEYISENLTSGGKVYILGGTAAVSENFENSAKEAGFDVVRLKGKARYETNLEILKEAGVNETDEILIATGTNFADSLSASATKLPMLLVGPGLTAEQKEFLATTSRKFVIIGGTGAVNEAVEAELAQIGTVERIKGKTRYETSVVIAERYFTDPAAAVLAYAQGFPDGLCGGPLAMNMGAPLILTSNEAPTAADDYIEGITVGAVTGGTGRITDDTVRAIFDLADDTEIPVQ